MHPLVLTRLVSRDDDPVVTLAWTVAVGLVVTTPLLILDWRPVGVWAWAVMTFSGLCFGAAQFCLARAFRNAPAVVEVVSECLENPEEARVIEKSTEQLEGMLRERLGERAGSRKPVLWVVIVVVLVVCAVVVWKVFGR